jgi:tripartite-type tricarboxylate transporter receptor subunit TctC
MTGNGKITSTRRRALLGLGTAMMAGGALPGRARAQTYPSRPVQLIVAYPPGGATDVIGRLLAERLREKLGQPVIVDNRPAGGATIGMAAAARAAPDGHTLAIGNGHTLSINPTLFADPGYSPTRDFTPISLICNSQNLVVVHPSVPANSLAELIAYMKAHPGQLNYASTGSGSPGHLAAELFKSMAGVDMVHVPYRGAAPVLADMLSGRVQVYFANPASVVGSLREGKLRALAVTGGHRSELFPDLPTAQEAGLPGFAVDSWYGLLGPAGLPPDIRRGCTGRWRRSWENRKCAAAWPLPGSSRSPARPRPSAN